MRKSKTTGQFPQRRETDEQAAKRATKIEERNKEQGYDPHGKFLDKGLKVKPYKKGD